MKQKLTNEFSGLKKKIVQTQRGSCLNVGAKLNPPLTSNKTIKSAEFS